MLSLRPPVNVIVWDTAVAPRPLVHHGAVFGRVARCLFVPMCEAKQRSCSTGHDSYFVGMLGVSELVKSHALVCKGIKMDHSNF